MKFDSLVAKSDRGGIAADDEDEAPRHELPQERSECYARNRQTLQFATNAA